MKRRLGTPHLIGSIIIGTCGLLVFLFGLFGYLAPRDFHGQISVTVGAPLADVWQELAELERLPNRRAEVESVEVTGTSEQGYRQWKEYLRTRAYRSVETVNEVSQEKIVNAATSSRFGLSGTWTYVLTAISPSSTSLTIEETSSVNTIIGRAWLTLVGRDRFLKREASSFQQ